MTASLAYRKNEAAILAGQVPEKYTRILPHVPGGRILEIGSAEGVLALLLAKLGKDVIALERSEERHEAALRLSGAWFQRDQPFWAPMFVNGAIGERLDLLNNVDTLVAVRMIYYLRGELDDIFAEIGHRVPNVVLCGNRNRAARFHCGTLAPDDSLGPFNFYAGPEGMTELLKRHGYRATVAVPDGDAIVVGRRA